MKRPLPLFLAYVRDAKGHGIAVSPFVGADVGASRLQSSPQYPAIFSNSGCCYNIITGDHYYINRSFMTFFNCFFYTIT